MGLSSRRKSERGTSIVEAAFVTPVFLFLIFGIIESGFLFRNYLAVNNAGLSGARAASVAGDDEDTDFLIVRTVAHGVEAMGVENLDFIVVYKATSPDDTVPPSCLFGGSTTLECNRFTRREFYLSLESSPGVKTDWACASAAQDRFWCPKDRNSQVPTVSGDPPIDYVGVYVQANHQYVTGFFGSESKLTSDRVIRLEPARDK
jgi:hypothetical protein